MIGPLEKPEYIHVLLNHLPVTALFVSWLVLVTGAILRNRMTMLLGLGLVMVFAASTLVVVYYGEQGYNRVYSMGYEEDQAWLNYHRDLAGRWKYLYYVTAIGAAAGLVGGLVKRKTLWLSVPLVILLALGSLAAGGIISEAGGRVRHPEFRNSPPPTEAPS